MADIFVLPSKGPSETWGLAINEAMASGCAVIATNKCGGAIDLIEDGENGYIIMPNLPALTEALEKATKTKQFLAGLKQQSVKRIQRFNFSATASAIENQLLSKAG